MLLMLEVGKGPPARRSDWFNSTNPVLEMAIEVGKGHDPASFFWYTPNGSSEYPSLLSSILAPDNALLAKANGRLAAVLF